MIRCIRTEFKKCMYFPFFLLAALGTLTLCLAAIGEYDYTGKSRTILEMMVRGVDGQTVDQSGLVLWLNGCSGWLTLILPLLTTFGYLVTLSSERQSGETGAAETAETAARDGNAAKREKRTSRNRIKTAVYVFE